MSDRWSNSLTHEQIEENESLQGLALLLLDQQYDYWYDPCGKSGHELNPTLTPRARTAMRRLKSLIWHGGEKKSDG